MIGHEIGILTISKGILFMSSSVLSGRLYGIDLWVTNELVRGHRLFSQTEIQPMVLLDCHPNTAILFFNDWYTCKKVVLCVCRF